MLPFSSPRSHRTIIAIAGIIAACHGTAVHAQADTARTLLKPTFSLGAGMLSFYGDVGAQNKGYSPLVARVGYELRATTPVTDWLEVSLFALHGRLGGNERSVTRNINFESRLTTGGILLTYNFNQFLKPGHFLEPYVSVGYESIEFLSKTDLYDAQGRRYNYWSDGTIRDIPENAPNATDAVVIQRDYTYESDVRESNQDGFGKYLERTWAIPVGAGVKMCLGGGFDIRFGTTVHLTRTDLIDGITSNSVGDRKGDAKMDRFIYSGVTMSYAIDLNHAKHKKFKSPLSVEETDAIALRDDEDGDGVTDWNDLCPHTPAGTAVSTSGCPLDGDGDGVPDDRDDEPNTLAGAPVNARGVTLTDDDILRSWLNYKDSANANIVTSRVESFGPVGKPRTSKASANKRQYVVKVGSQMEGISEDMIQKILSLPDVRTIEQGDTTFYVVGNYADLPEALRRQLGLQDQGINGQVMVEENGRLHDIDGGAGTQGKGGKDGAQGGKDGAHGGKDGGAGTEGGAGSDVPNNGKALFRVQLGAFRNPPSESIFNGIPDLVKIKGDDGMTRYYTGSTQDINEAARHKVDMLLKGFNGAFLVAFKDGKRIALKDAGAQLNAPEDPNPVPTSGVDKKRISFRIQVGTFAGNVPVETMGKYLELGDVTAVPTANSVRYMYGSYPTRAAAEAARKELLSKGFADSFLVGDLDGRIISVDDAQRLLNEP